MTVSLPRATAGPEQRCILCGVSGNPPGIDHIVPAGLGAHVDLCLPKGTTCEPCNNHFGRQIDEAMVHLFEVRLIQALHRVPRRKKRILTEIELSNGVMRFPRDGGVEIEVQGEGHITKRSEKDLLINVIDKRAKSGDQWRRATRSLMKSGLSLLCYSGGKESSFIPDSTFHPGWDPLRAAIQGEPYHGYLLVGPFDIFAKPNFALSRLNDLPGIDVATHLRFGGLDLIVDLVPKPAPQPTREWAREHHFQVMDIAPRPRR